MAEGDRFATPRSFRGERPLTSWPARRRRCRSRRYRRRTGALLRPWCAADRAVRPIALSARPQPLGHNGEAEIDGEPHTMFRNDWRMRACGSCTNVLVAGSTPCMPATKTKSPALAPRLQVPTALIAPAGSSVLTSFGDSARAGARPPANARVRHHRNSNALQHLSPPFLTPLSLRKWERMARQITVINEACGEGTIAGGQAAKLCRKTISP